MPTPTPGLLGTLFATFLRRLFVCKLLLEIRHLRPLKHGMPEVRVKIEHKVNNPPHVVRDPLGLPFPFRFLPSKKLGSQGVADWLHLLDAFEESIPARPFRCFF